MRTRTHEEKNLYTKYIKRNFKKNIKIVIDKVVKISLHLRRTQLKGNKKSA